MKAGDYRIFAATELMNPIFHGKFKIQICVESALTETLVWKNLNYKGLFCSDNKEAFSFTTREDVERTLEQIKTRNQ